MTDLTKDELDVLESGGPGWCDVKSFERLIAAARHRLSLKNRLRIYCHECCSSLMTYCPKCVPGLSAGWQPIETAPKKQWLLCIWQGSPHCFVLKQDVKGGSWYGQDAKIIPHPPTHWQHLPAPPNSERQEIIGSDVEGHAQPNLGGSDGPASHFDQGSESVNVAGTQALPPGQSLADDEPVVVSRRADLNCEPSGSPFQNGLKPLPDVAGLVERLRHYAFPNQTSFDGTLMEAAAALEQMQREVERLRVLLLQANDGSELLEAQAEDERLRAALEAIRDTTEPFNSEWAANVARAALSQEGKE